MMTQMRPLFIKRQNSSHLSSLGSGRMTNIILSYMMYQKAILFKDPAMAAKILKGGHPREVKNMGRKIKNFDEDTWVQHRETIVTKGTLLKFSKPVKDEGLKDKLLATEDKEIVEASPYDRIWGIGFTEQHAEDLREDWGLNLLGKAIMTVRAQLQQGEVKA